MKINFTSTEKLRSDRYINEMTQKHGKSIKFSYIVTPTGIGTRVDIRCNKEINNKDITDYERW